jgi:hypothetical protein
LPFKAEAHPKTFKNSVRTSKRTQHFTITKITWLMLFKEIIDIYSENHEKDNTYKIQCYRVLRMLGHIIATRL